MARIRSIKPDFWTDEKMVECSMAARLFFIGMLNFSDDAGNLPRSAKKLKMQIFPADTLDCEPLVMELVSHGMLVEYSSNGEKFLHIKGFLKHQKIDRPTKSNIPRPDFAATPRGFDEDSTTERKGEERRGEEGNRKGMEGREDTGAPTARDGEPERGATKPGAVCVVLKSEGIASVNPSHAGLLAVLESGATLADFVQAVGLAKEARKPTFAYVLGIVKNILSEAPKVAAPGVKNSSNRNQSAETFRERDARLAREQWEAQTGKVHPDNPAHPDHPDNPARNHAGACVGGEIIESQAREIVEADREH